MSNNIMAVEETKWNAIETVSTTRAGSSSSSCGGSWEDLPPHPAMHESSSLSKEQQQQQQQQQPVHFHLHVHVHSPSSSSSSSSPAQQLPSTLMASAPVMDAVPTTVTTTTTSYVLPADYYSSSSSSSCDTVARLLSSIRQQQSPQSPQPHQQQHEQSQALLPEQPHISASSSTRHNEKEKAPWNYPGRNQVLRFRGRGQRNPHGDYNSSNMNTQPHRRKRSRDDTDEDDSGSHRQLQPSRNNSNNNKRRRWLIRAEHPVKLLWDFLTIVLSIANAYATHAAIRDRQFGSSGLVRFCELWFVLDFLLNFVTERHIGDGVILQDFKSVWARYLTTWFVVDLLSLMPGELIYVKPIIDQQNRRGWLKKSFFRTKAVVGVTRVLRVGHVRLFGKVARHTKRAGMGANRLLRFIIKYAPKYLLFLRNMKGVVAVRVLRQVHWLRKVWLNLRRKITTPAIVDNNNGTSLHGGKSDDDTDSMTEGYDDDDDFYLEDEYEEYQDDDDDDDDDEDNTSTNAKSLYARHRDENGVSHGNRWEFVDDGGEPY